MNSYEEVMTAIKGRKGFVKTFDTTDCPCYCQQAFQY